MKKIYLIRHSGPFVEYEGNENIKWEERNKNMILSVLGEENAKKLCLINELKNVDKIYSSNSARAIGTAKYIAEANCKRINIEDKINERRLGIEYVSDLPDGFIKNQFDNLDLKYKDGESINDVNNRFGDFINEILHLKFDKIALFIHGVVLMSYLSTIADVTFDGNNFNLSYKGENILNGTMKNPDVYEVVFDNSDEVMSVKNL